MKIVISGQAASGKSSVAKLLAANLGWKHFSIGDVQREIALEKGISISELGKLEANDKSIDRMIDEKQKEIGRNNDDFVIDSWLGALFIPDAVKVFIHAELDIRAARRFDHRREEESFESMDETIRDMDRRERINRERWLRYYDFDYLDMANYDLVIDSSALPIKEVADKIADYIKKVER